MVQGDHPFGERPAAALGNRTVTQRGIKFVGNHKRSAAALSKRSVA